MWLGQVNRDLAAAQQKVENSKAEITRISNELAPMEVRGTSCASEFEHLVLHYACMFVHCVVVVVFRLVVRIILEMGGGLFLFTQTTITWLWSSIHCFNTPYFIS